MIARRRQRGTILMALMLVLLLLNTVALAYWARRMAERGRSHRAWLHTAARVLARSGVEAALVSAKNHRAPEHKQSFSLVDARAELTIEVSGAQVTSRAVVRDGRGAVAAEAIAKATLSTGGTPSVTTYSER